MDVRVQFTYKRANYALWVAYLLTTFCNIFMFYEVTDQVQQMKAIENTLFFINFSIISVYLAASISILVCIYDITKSLNENVLKLFEGEKFRKIDVIKNLSKVFTKITDLCDKYSRSFSMLNLNFAFSTFLFTSVENYCLFAFFKTPNILNFKLLVFAGLWVASFSIYFVAMMIVSELINRQGDKTLKILEKISPTQLSAKEFRRISIFIQQISHETLEIYCGAFKLNLNFLFEFFVSVFSITLMFFQFYGMNK